MALRDLLPFLRTKQAVPEPVSAALIPYGFLAVIGHELTANEAWRLYKSVGTLAKAVDLIADQASYITPIVEINGQRTEPGDDSAGGKLMQVLKRPGYNRDRRRFVKEALVQELVTGTAYVGLEGNKNFAPIAMDVYMSHQAIQVDGHDGWPQSISIHEPRRGFVFRRQHWRNELRYLANNAHELVSIYDMAGDIKGRGLSRLQAVRAEVNLKLSSLQHNTSLMQRGATLSGILNFKDTIDPTVAESIVSEFQRAASGAANAGGVFVTGGSEADFKSLTLNNRDMEWMELVKTVDDAIISRYGIPTTLYDKSAQTYDNYRTAWEQLYEQAVLPAFNRFYGALSAAMYWRTGEEVEITHDALEIETLASRAAERATALFEKNLITANEGRELVGYEPVPGGDQLTQIGAEDGYEDLYTDLIDVGVIDGEGKPALAGPKDPKGARS
jgi:HK97 family phage portal protein